MNDKGKVTKGGVKDRLKAIEGEAESDEEREALERCLALIDAESAAARAVKEAQAALDEKVLARYGKLTEAEIKMLVVEDKWLALPARRRRRRSAADDPTTRRAREGTGGAVRAVAAGAGARSRDVQHKVEGHLKKMGLAWG